MRRLLLPLLAAALLVPATASAGPLGVAPPLHFYDFRPDCTTVTGGPGEVLTGFREGPPELLRATRAGLERGTVLDFGAPGARCPVGATSATGGASVVVCCDDAAVFAATFRDPGAGWSDPTELTPGEEWLPGQPRPAVSELGHAAVALTETRYRDQVPVGSRVAVVRKAPGGGFGAPEVVGGPYRDAPTGVQARVAAGGETVVLWHAPEAARTPRRNTADVMVAVAPPGGPFGPATRLTEVPRRSRSSLAVADDGHALISVSDGRSVLVSERAPGAAFGTPAAVAPLHDPVGARTSAALGAGGQATVSWSGMALGGIDVVTRTGPGAFSAPLRLAAPDRSMPYDIFMANAALSQLPGIWRFGGGDVEATLSAGGALVSWNGPHGARRAAHLATVPLDGGAPVVEKVGGEFADPERVRQVRLADGVPALTWTDITRSDDIRIWLAAEGAERPEPAALPRVSVGHLNRFGWARVRCSAACEVRVAAVGKPASDVRLRLERAGSGTVDFDSYGDSVRLGPKVRLRVTYGAPDGTRTRSMLLTRRVRGYRPWSNVRAVGLRAVRRGDAIRVSWRLNGPQPTYVTFYATGSPTRDRSTEPVVDERARNLGSARSFAVTLRPAATVRYVTLYSFGLRQFKQVVRVR